MQIKYPFLYDILLFPFELMLIRSWRRCLWTRLPGLRVLEVGAGTGLNIPFYGKERQVTALDIGKSGLQRAKRRADKTAVQVDFIQGNAEALPFPGESFDAVAATFLFCSIENPRCGLAEMQRVLRPGGTLLLLEHVRAAGLLGKIMDIFSAPIYRLFNEHIARETDKLVRQSGFVNITVMPLFFDLVKLIRAEKPTDTKI